MTVRLLHRAENGKLLLFFNGWSMDDTLFEGWENPGFNVMTVHDYTAPEALPDLSPYTELHLAAWSLGVRIAAELLAGAPYRFESAAAFNGTLRPVDPEYGIEPAVFSGTVANWGDERARARFYRRLAGTAEFRLPQRSPESQQAELAAFEKHILSAPVPANVFKTARIGGRDRIIPAAAQRSFWSGEAVSIIEEPEAPHFPFRNIHSFEELIDAGRNR